MSGTFQDLQVANGETYDGRELREWNTFIELPGTIAKGGWKVAQTAGGGLRVDVFAGAGYVSYNAASPGTIYKVRSTAVEMSDNFVDGGISPNPAADPRLDQVIIKVFDKQHGDSVTDARFQILEGSPQPGTTLDNRNGAATPPDGSLRLADLLINPGATSVSNPNIRDRRPWARGLFRAIFGDGGGDFPTSSTSPVAMPQMSITSEFHGVPVMVEFNCDIIFADVADHQAAVQLTMDGSALGGSKRTASRDAAGGLNYVQHTNMGIKTLVQPSAGRHTFAAQFWGNNGAKSVYIANSGADLPVFFVREFSAVNAETW